MKTNKIILFVLFIFVQTWAYGQNVQDFKVKNPKNSADRTQMLDILRAKLYEEHKQELIFVVEHFKVSQNYAWFKGTAQRKDGKPPKLSADADCCHVEALFKKSGSKWYIVESGAFSTDVWYAGIEDRYKDANKAIFQ